MKKKVTLTLSYELAETISYLSTVLDKNQNEILETAFWSWWQSQDDELKSSINKMIRITKNIRKEKE